MWTVSLVGSSLVLPLCSVARSRSLCLSHVRSYCMLYDVDIAPADASVGLRSTCSYRTAAVGGERREGDTLPESGLFRNSKLTSPSLPLPSIVHGPPPVIQCRASRSPSKTATLVSPPPLPGSQTTRSSRSSPSNGGSSSSCSSCSPPSSPTSPFSPRPPPPPHPTTQPPLPHHSTLPPSASSTPLLRGHARSSRRRTACHLGSARFLWAGRRRRERGIGWGIGISRGKGRGRWCIHCWGY